MRTRSEILLVWLLRMHGAAAALAMFAVLVPAGWMAAVHREWLGLGEMPLAPVVVYLARTVSLFYAFLGAFSIYVSVDVRRFRPVVIFLGASMVVMGLILTAVIAQAGLPWWWAAGEGLAAAGIGVALLVLARAVPDAAGAAA